MPRLPSARWGAVALAAATGFGVAVLFAVTHFAGSSGSGVYWIVGQGGHIDRWVEQQSSSDCTPNPYPGTGTLCVWNNIGIDGFHNGLSCTWNYNDAYGVSLEPNGSLAGHASASYTLCDVAEGFNSPNAACNTGCGNPTSIDFSAASNRLIARYCSTAAPGFGGSSRCWTIPPLYNPGGRNYTYQMCEREVYDYGTWGYPIQDSYGGLGVITDLTITLSNPTGQKISKINGDMNSIGIGQQGDWPWCDWYATSTNIAAPYRWSP